MFSSLYDRPNALPNLKILEISGLIFITNENGTEPEGPVMETWDRFLRHFAPQLEELTLRLERDERKIMFDPGAVSKRHVYHALASGKFRLLRKLELIGLKLDPADVVRIQKSISPDLEILISESIWEEEGEYVDDD